MGNEEKKSEGELTEIIEQLIGWNEDKKIRIENLERELYLAKQAVNA